MQIPDSNQVPPELAPPGTRTTGAGGLNDTQASPPPLPALCSGSNIFDGLVSGSLLLLFCLMSWRQGGDAFGSYSFFRYSSTSGTILALATVFSVLAVGIGFFLLTKRILHGRYCRLHFPRPEKKKGPSVWAEMKEALDELLGLQKAQNPQEEGIAQAKKRVLKNWFAQEKTRMGLSTFILTVLMYATPKFVLVSMGTHALLYYLLEFMAFMATLNLWIIAWVELGE